MTKPAHADIGMGGGVCADEPVKDDDFQPHHAMVEGEFVQPLGDEMWRPREGSPVLVCALS